MSLLFNKQRLNKKHFYWINFIWFQAIWFIAVLYTQQAIPILILSLCIHFIVTPTRRADLLCLLGITLLGSLGDFLLTLLGIYSFGDTLFIPLWLILLWAHFALTLNHSMHWLGNIPRYACIAFGAIFGTLSYYAGSELGAVVLHSNLLISLFVISVLWGSLLPLYITISHQANIINRNLAQ